MKTILATSAAALFAVFSVVAPANAGGGVTFSFGGGPYGGFYGGPYGNPHGGVYLDVGPNYNPGYNNSWKKHVQFCFKHHKNYNPNTNLYKTKWGYMECESPWY
jgi:hypothetical protein